MAATKKNRAKKARATKQPIKQSAKKETCFIIMPFGEWFDYYHDTIYVPAIESTGLIPRRADDLYRPSSIVNDIWALTQQAKVILADLSGKNPNVFYELGLAHAVAKPAILVAESIEDVPFDLRALRVIIYDKNEPEWGTTLREKIEAAINEVLASPLESVLPTFLKVKDSTPKKTVTKAEKELISLRQDMDLLKHELQRQEVSARSSRRHLTASEVELVRRYIKDGAPDEYIVRRIVNRGVSASVAKIVTRNLRSLIESESKLESASEMDEKKGESS